MSIYPALRSALFALPPESAHRVVMKAIRLGLIRSGGIDQPVNVFGIQFPNPVGLAAGFDKSAEAVSRWQNLGFGFAEIGTVTRHPQPGNDPPRLWRIVPERALVNRMGFNNAGADVVAERLSGVESRIPLGVNLGKSKITELAEAPSDYAYSFSRLRDLASYFVVNVSSPNTPGLRTLQDADSLARILGAIRDIDDAVPLLVKVAPDLEDSQLDEVVETAVSFGLTGIVATNTTIDRSMLRTDPNLPGGLSGAPLREKAASVRRKLRDRMPPKMTLIGSGGIMSVQDALVAMEEGCDLLQVYTGWIYNGPTFPREIVAALHAKSSLKGNV